MVRVLSLAALCLFAAVGASAQEHGTVIAVHKSPRNLTVPAQHGGDGVVATNGVSVNYDVQIFRVETESKFYELEDSRPTLALGDAIEFRIQKGRALVRRGNKERKYKVIGEELKAK